VRSRVIIGGSRLTLLRLEVTVPTPQDMAVSAGFSDGSLAFCIGVECERYRAGELYVGTGEPDPGSVATDCGWEDDSPVRTACIAGVTAERERKAAVAT
jgi:hypothetical protein